MTGAKYISVCSSTIDTPYLASYEVSFVRIFGENGPGFNGAALYVSSQPNEQNNQHPSDIDINTTGFTLKTSKLCFFHDNRFYIAFQELSMYISNDESSLCNIMTSWYGNIFRETGPLWEESTGDRWIPFTKVSDAKLRCFLRSAPVQTVEQTIETLVIWDAVVFIMTSL